MAGVQAAIDICITTSGSCGQGANSILTTILTTLAGVAVGSVLAFLGASRQARQQRNWQDERDWFDHARTQARELDDALIETQLRVQEKGVGEDESRWGAAHREWEQGWIRVTPFLDSPELEARYRAIGTILMELRFYEGGASITQRVNVVQRAIANARQALAYFARGHELPAASFPHTPELLDLLGGGDPDSLARDAPLRKWLDDHPEAPWHPASEGEGSGGTEERRRFPWIGKR
jgi:hypothetical protein